MLCILNAFVTLNVMFAFLAVWLVLILHRLLYILCVWECEGNHNWTDSHHEPHGGLSCSLFFWCLLCNPPVLSLWCHWTLSWTSQPRLVSLFSCLLFSYLYWSGQRWTFTFLQEGWVMAFLPLAGFLINFISVPVTSGFTSAASVTIALSQLKGILGLGKYVDANAFLETMEQIFTNIKHSSLWDIVLGVVCCIILLFLRVKVIFF